MVFHVIHFPRHSLILPSPSADISPGVGQEGRGKGVRSESYLPSADSDADLIGGLPVFVVSLCDGISGALLACKERTPDVQAHAVESDANLRELFCHHFPQISIDPDVLTMDVDSLISRVDYSAHWELLILVGGPPANLFFSFGVPQSWF